MFVSLALFFQFFFFFRPVEKRQHFQQMVLVQLAVIM
jgi:hypothetical protein